jgi:hypothetical protein
MDPARTGANLQETALSKAAVEAGFGKLWVRAVRGAVYAQPLYVRGVEVPGRGARNVLYVATMNNYVYAFDVDDPAAAPLWGPVWLGPAIALPDEKIGGGAGYNDIAVQIGVVSTPVISTERTALYVVAATKEGGNYHHRLHALDLATGQEKLGGPVEVAGRANDPFVHHLQNQRPALLEVDGRIFVAFASYGDHTDQNTYHGWVVSFDATDLSYQNTFIVTPGGELGGIWQAGQGPASDGQKLYVMTGNGSSAGDGSELSCAFVELEAGTLQRTGWFAPSDWIQLSAEDLDLGSGGVLVVPGTQLIVGGGKEGRLFVLQRGALPDRAQDAAALQVFQATAGRNDPNAPAPARDSNGYHHIHGSPVFWQCGENRRIYLGGEADRIRAFALDANDRFVTNPADQSNVTTPARSMPGAIMSLSANGADPNSGVLWASFPHREDANQRVVDGVIYAFDATNLGRVLWHSKQNPARDDVGSFPKFCPPVPVDGRVYLPSLSGPYGKVTPEECAIEGLALAGFADARLVVAWTGTDGGHHLNVARSSEGFESSPGGLTFGEKVTLGEKSPHGPALAYGNDRLLLAWTGDDGAYSLNVMTEVDYTRGFENKVTLGESSVCGPAVAFFRGQLFLAWTGTDSKHSLNVIRSADCRNFSGKIILNEQSDAGPGLAATADRLYLLWRGNDANHSLNILESQDGVNWGNKITLAQSSDFTPALAHAEALYLVWTGRDYRLNLLASDSGSHDFDERARQTYKDSSAAAPALTTFHGKSYLAWTGTDGASHINVAALGGGQVSAYGSIG